MSYCSEIEKILYYISKLVGLVLSDDTLSSNYIFAYRLH